MMLHFTVTSRIMGSGNNLHWQWELILPVGTLNLTVGMPCAFYSQQPSLLSLRDTKPNVIQKTNAIVIRDSEETLMLEEENRSKMLQKQKDPMMSKKKVNTKPVDYAALNQLLQDFNTRFVPQTELSADQVFWDEIIPFVKALKDLFNSFDQFLIDELPKVQDVFNQMEQAVEQHRVESKRFQNKMKEVLKENERLLKQAISKDIVNIVVTANVNNAYEPVNACERYVTLETELQNDFIKKECYEKLFKQYTTLEKHCTSLESQEKDMVIMKLKERIKSLSGNLKEEKIKRELEEIETINIELDHRVTKLVTKNAHLKHPYKQLYDSIKSSPLKDTLRKLKGKVVVDNAITLHLIDLELQKIDVASLVPKLQNNRTAHNGYLKHTQEETTTLNEIVKNERLLNPLNTSLDYTCKYTKRIQELLIILKQTCPCINDLGVNLPTSASRSNPPCNTKKDRIQQRQSRAKKNKLEAYSRNVRPSLLNKKSVVNTKDIASVPNSKLNVHFDLQCATCNGHLFSDNPDSYVLKFINSMNARVKSKSVKKPLNRKIWKPTRKVFTNIGYKWRPKGRTFTIVGNAYLDSRCSKHMTEDRSQLTNFVNKFLGTVKFDNDHVVKIMGYGDYKIRNVTISRVYFVEGLGHNLFYVRQFCDSDLEVAFRQHTRFIHNLKGADLLTRSRGNNLYTLSLGDMMASFPICLLSKALKTKS
nr:hypothetical protein [Tanacetum cinerariifolium]